MSLISIVTEILFVLMMLVHMFVVNKSISRLEEKFEELDDEVFKNSKESKAEVEKEKDIIETAGPVIKKRRTRKPKISKETV